MLQEVSLKNYRQLSFSATLSPSANIVVATNGRGKSNFLESLYLAATGGVFRPINTFADLIGPELDFAKVDLRYADDMLEITISASPKLTRKFVLNQRSRQLSTIVGQFPAVLFAPHAVDIINGEPAARRTDLDDLLKMVSKEYFKAYVQYQKLLKNRNALLKHLRESFSDRSTLNFWDQQLSIAAQILITARHDFISSNTEYVREMTEVFRHPPGTELAVNYLPNIFSETGSHGEFLLSKLQNNRDKEIAAGQTLYGPHKDDFQLTLNGQDLRYFGSRGQQRLAVLIWKLAQAKYIQLALGKKPLLLLDDLMSELDNFHREQVSDYLLSAELQFVLTGIEKEEIPSKMLLEANHIDID